MNAQECFEVIAKSISDYVGNVLYKRGNCVAKLFEEYNELADKATDAYSTALIMEGVSPELRAPFPFTNRPYGTFATECERKMEALFDLLELPTTYAAAYRLAGSLKRKDIRSIFSEEKLDKLTNAELSPLRIRENIEWCNKAKVIIATMRYNINDKKVLESVTAEQAEFAKGLSFDWYYSYSDDNGVWRAGKAAHDRVREWATDQIAINQQLGLVIETICNWYNFGPGFFLDTSRLPPGLMHLRMMSTKHLVS